MKTKSCSNPHLALSVMIIFSLWLQTSANHTGYPPLRDETWSPTSQNLSGGQNKTEESTNSPLSLNFSSQTTTFEMQTTLPSFSPTNSPQNSTSPAPSAVSTTGELGKSSKPKGPMTTETCEDSKSLILICFIVIAVLVLICTSLFLSTVIVANKISFLKRAQQGKRRPRSNGDLLATNSLWPTAAGTWQRMPRESGTELMMQELISGRDAGNHRKTEDETTEKLTKAADNGQESKESSQSHKPILTDFVVEI